MKIFIDGSEADVDSGSHVSLSLAMASVEEPGEGRAGYTRSITIPMTPRNRGIMGGCEEIYARDRFNDEVHEARIEFSGCTVMEGVVHVTECSHSMHGVGYYKFNVIGSARLWAGHAASNSLSSLFPSLRIDMSQENIIHSWTDSSILKYLPVRRDIYNGSPDAARVLGVSDYHPFFNIRGMLLEIFRQAGYTVQSSFFDTSFFRSLYMSGRLGISVPVVDVEEEMDFKAGRFTESAALSDATGRIYADPHLLANTIGNIVDTADPDEVRDGQRVQEAFDNGKCFKIIDGRAAFQPRSEVRAGFKYELRFITQCEFYSPEVMCGLNKIYMGNNQFHEVVIRNPYIDYKRSYTLGESYTVFVRSTPLAGSYRLFARRLVVPNADWNNLQPGEYQDTVLLQFAGPSASVRITIAGSNVRLFVERRGVEAVMLSEDEWMLTDRYAQTVNRAELSVVCESAPETITPSSPKYFDSIYFSCSFPEMGHIMANKELVMKEAFISPVFENGAGDMDVDIPFSDAVPAQMNRMEVIDAVRHMFNLCFYTDNLGKKVFIEPRVDFFGGPVVDWSGRIDFSKPYTVQELGDKVGKTITLRYNDEDGAVSRLDMESGGIFGAWSAEVANRYALYGETVFRNQLFSPALNVTGVVEGASSASLPNVGDRGRGADKKGSLDFPTKVVRYAGMVPLAAGEVWPQGGSLYPLAAFHSPAKGLTLCFEDRDGVRGLHKYWDCNLDAYNSGKRLTVWMKLYPDELEAIVQPNALGRDFRARYKLRIEGEESLWQLEEVCDYNPADPSVKCVFIKIFIPT